MAQITDFFVGANSGEGFRNLFPEMVDIEDTYDLMVLKGGPGVGKNTFMREVVRAMEAAGTPVVLRRPGLPGRRCTAGAALRGSGWYIAPRERSKRTPAADGQANPASSLPGTGNVPVVISVHGRDVFRLRQSSIPVPPSHTVRRSRGSDTKQGRYSGPSPPLLMKKAGN